MADETVQDEKYNPDEHTAAEVKDELAEADEAEKLQIAAAEQAGKNRPSVLKAAGVEDGMRLDRSGRVLLPWEVAPTPAEEV